MLTKLFHWYASRIFVDLVQEYCEPNMSKYNWEKEHAVDTDWLVA